MSDPLSVILHEMRRLEPHMEDMLKQLEEQIYVSQYEAPQKVVKKARWEEIYSFMKKGNQEQNDFNKLTCKCLKKERTEISTG